MLKNAIVSIELFFLNEFTLLKILEGKSICY